MDTPTPFGSLPRTPDTLCLQIMITIPLVNTDVYLIGTEDIKKYRKERYSKEAYRFFEIPKRSGGMRTILAPCRELKMIQKAIACILQDRWEPIAQVHGFVKSRSVVSGAARHVGKPYLLNIDLKDFFQSITAGEVLAALYQNGMSAPCALLVSSICTTAVESGMPVLPQGAPSSPILSNIVCDTLDRRICGLAECFGITYTRYADDMSFSAPYNAFRPEDAFCVCLESIIREEGFTINRKKTRLQKTGARQEVTGLTVCEKVNVSRKWLKGLRAEIHRLETGSYTKEDIRRVLGRIAWLRHVRGGWEPVSRKLDSRVRKLKARIRSRNGVALDSPP